MDFADAVALTSPEGNALLASLPPYSEADVVALTTRLRSQGFAPNLVAAALTQSRLRTKARAKFGPAADHMLFTPDALEQATRAPLASRHARRFIAAGISEVFDGGCGVGADTAQFARAGLDVVGIEADPATALLASYNLNLVSGEHAGRIETGFVEEIAPSLKARENSAWWFDPARRVSGVADIHGKTKRTFSLAALSPEWPLIQRLATTTRAAGAKLSPSLAHSDIPAGCEAEFTSYGGDVLEATVWWGDASVDPGPTATIVSPRRDPAKSPNELPNVEELHVTGADAVGASSELATRTMLGPYLYEADKALTRSGLVGALQRAVQGYELTSGYGYVSADHLIDIGLLGRRYRVLDLVPLHTKTLRTYLRERNVGRVTIKKRDITLDADQLRRELKLKGSTALTLLLSNLDGERMAFVVEEIPRPS